MVIGITGQLCAGKNIVATAFERLGWFVIDEDAVGHKALEVRESAIIEEFGDSILDESGRVSRRLLGAAVFGYPERLRLLESIVHPWMVEETSRMLDSRTEEHAAVNAAILFHMGLHRLCDRVVIVRAPFLTRFFRCVRRDHISFGQIVRRMASQRSLNRAPKGVDTVVVWNAGTRRSLEKRVMRLAS